MDENTLSAEIRNRLAGQGAGSGQKLPLVYNASNCMTRPELVDYLI